MDRQIWRDRSAFNIEEFLARVNNDVEHVFELIELFLEIYPESFQDIEGAVRKRDAEAIHEAAHRFKGSLSFIHAEPAVAAALRLEQAGRSRSIVQAHQEFECLNGELERLCGDLRTFLAACNR